MKLRTSILILTDSAFARLSGRLMVLVVQVSLTAAFAGCDKSPTRPTPLGRPETPQPVTPAPAPTPAKTTLIGAVLIEGMEGLPGARVEITAGIGSGLSTTTDENGRFELQNVGGTITAQFTHEGYSPAQASVDVAETSFIGVSLSPIGPVPSVAGTYTLTIAAASDCGLRNELKTRRYTATVSQDNSRLDVTLSDAPLKVTCPTCYGHGFQGYVAQDRVTFFLHGQQLDPLFGWPDVVEMVGPDEQLMFSGKASAPPGPKMVGVFSGDFQLVNATSGEVVATCSSEHHKFTLSR